MSLKGEKIYAIDGPEGITTKEFINRYYDILHAVLENPDSAVIVADFGVGIYVARYLKQHHYRKGTLYHIEENPRNIASFFKCQRFSSLEKLRKEMKRVSHEYVYFDAKEERI